MLNTEKTKQETNALRNKWQSIIDPSTVPPTIIRKCKDCGEEALCGWNYTFSRLGKPEYRARCTECFKTYAKKRQKRNRKSITAARKIKIRKRKVECVAYLGGRCQGCGYDKSIVALTFHHRDKDEKERDVSHMLDWPWAKLQAELDKCDLLCFNCHMALHGEDYDDQGQTR